MLRRILALTMAVLPACTELPPLDRTVDAQARAAPYPDLIATERLLNAVEEPRLDAGDRTRLEARGDRLRGRAARLRNRELSE